MRIGYGWDSHEFKRGVTLKIGGVTIPHSSGLAGHSDGDVLLHALTDALLGAVAAGDIGTFFPPTDPRWKGADSVVFVREAMRQVRSQGYVVANVDSTLILAEPKIVPHAKSIQERVAQLVGVEASDVGVKAKTPEGMGTDNAAIAHVAVLLTRKARRGERKALAVERVPQSVVDEVVAKVLVEDPMPRRPRKVKR
ncbi:MAG TPA: 2-C-methyl-D-erythritol 2,4-cyclodiphosphate synthase [Terriglobales bacterium]|jgi:2-C-methyl-D-erythritol 2,4-cyclodiphosphate synthase|nr:2-C-methyl-D-erythritol 2,4-cyclodiphosphate synthase [Terriglobales bacterium]